MNAWYPCNFQTFDYFCFMYEIHQSQSFFNKLIARRLKSDGQKRTSQEM